MTHLKAGFNDLATVDPQLASEWHPTKNGDLLPTQVTAGSTRKVYWKCANGHEWSAGISSRHKGSGCPYCAGNRAIAGTNDLSTTNPELAAEWHPTKNGDLLPTQVTAGSNKKVWWLGKCGHEWKAVIHSRVAGNGCPFCSNEIVLPGFNDFATTHPLIAAEWNYRRNGDLSPEDFTYGSERKVWWLCAKCGNEWEATINNRTNGYFKTGCPKCSGEHATSFPEQALFFYIKQHVDENAKSRFMIKMDGKDEEIDVWIPSLTCGIEYDGEYYHARRHKKDAAKDAAAANASIRLIRLIECDRNAIEGDRIYLDVHHNQKSNIEHSIQYVVSMLAGRPIPINMATDTASIMSNYKLQEEKKSVKALFPDLAKQWDYERNGTLKPENISYGSIRKVWWICPVCGKSFLKSPNARTALRTRELQHCPHCPTKRGEASRKPVICVETGKIYPSATKAAAEVARAIGSISRACKDGSTCAGLHWRYVDADAETESR